MNGIQRYKHRKSLTILNTHYNIQCTHKIRHEIYCWQIDAFLVSKFIFVVQNLYYKIIIWIHIDIYLYIYILIYMTFILIVISFVSYSKTDMLMINWFILAEYLKQAKTQTRQTIIRDWKICDLTYMSGWIMMPKKNNNRNFA